MGLQTTVERDITLCTLHAIYYLYMAYCLISIFCQVQIHTHTHTHTHTTTKRFYVLAFFYIYSSHALRHTITAAKLLHFPACTQLHVDLNIKVYVCNVAYM